MAAYGLADPPIWLHARHGDARPMPMQLGDQSPGSSFAEDFAASLLAAGNPIAKGLPCALAGMYLRGGAWSTPIFLSDVSVAQLVPGIVLIAVVPRMPSLGLREAIADGTGQPMEGGEFPAPPQHVWLLLREGCSDPEARLAVLDRFSCAGSLRSDLPVAFTACHKSVGEGAYAVVHVMRSSSSGEEVAVKKMHPGIDLTAVQREVHVLYGVTPHEHIVNIRGTFWSVEERGVIISVVFDLAKFGDLLVKVLKEGALAEDSARPLVSCLLQGLAHIHSRSIVHRDVKAENILIKGPEHAIISDFGLATPLSDDAQMARRCGSPGYVAPEVCLGLAYDVKVDTFGAGVVLFFVLSTEMPFCSPDRDTAATMRKTVKCSLHLHKPPWDTKTSPLRKLLRFLIHKEVDQRASALEALQHPWFAAAEQGPDLSSLAYHGNDAGAAVPPAPYRPGATGYPSPPGDSLHLP